MVFLCYNNRRAVIILQWPGRTVRAAGLVMPSVDEAAKREARRSAERSRWNNDCKFAYGKHCGSFVGEMASLALPNL